MIGEILCLILGMGIGGAAVYFGIIWMFFRKMDR